jgi:RNA polymerase sigma factor (sigma-70 family)
MAADQTADHVAHPWGRTIRHLRRAALAREGGGLTDGQLLECYVARRDEAAFEAIVRRHGPMVLGVCRRVIGNAHDAEDAFQATFLVLVRKAASIGQRDAVGNWLFGVAYRAALKARSVSRRRQAREKQVKNMPERWVEPEDLWHDLRPLLDAELLRLPDKYRAAILLCDLEGRSRRDAAQLLGLREGTLSSRLAAGRKMLASRLARRGLALSGAGVAAVLTQGVATAAVPIALIHSTAKAAMLTPATAAAAGVLSAKVLSLTEGVLKAMWMTKLKLATAVLLAVGVVGVGTGVAERYASTGGRAADEVAAAPAPAPDTKQPEEKKAIPMENPAVPSPDGVYLASANANAITLSQVMTGKILWKTTSHKDNVTALAFSADGKVLYSAAKDATVKAIDAASGKELRSISHKLGIVMTLSVSPDGKVLFVTADDGTLNRWDTETGKSLP